jgi:hypothetical protein
LQCPNCLICRIGEFDICRSYSALLTD